MKIVVGLGNVGEKYLKTRHNCGFLALDEFTKQLETAGIDVSWKNESKLEAEVAKINYNGEKILLVKPTTFMNLSGEAVSKILNFYKEEKSNLVVIYDDIDLPLGKLRVREKGSAGTHNGMKSIIQCLGSEDFNRIRIGIESRGELAPKQQDLADFVLGNFGKAEYPLISEALKQSIEELKKLL
ncbi:MAG: aminoacyl-tRNA hydrolase [Candidatus Peregrinibacteria bacterium]|nr:aminoacyl-tRNA hydrolase [Candidatus Peregrinibacteria bacterium]